MNCSRGLQTLLIISCVVAVALSAPVHSRDCPEASRWDFYELFLRAFLDSLEFQEERTSNITLELNGTFFEYIVCPHVDTYSHLQITLNDMSEDDGKYTDISLLSFITQRQTETLCGMVKRDCQDQGLECGSMSCNVSSIAKNCILVRDRLSKPLLEIWDSYSQTGADVIDSIQNWLGEILGNELVDQSTWTTMAAVIRRRLCITCTMDENAVGTFTCEFGC